MELLRNASGLMLTIGSGRLGRADDPETHISRLNHFGQGMGIDLSSTHSQFSSKKLTSYEGLPEGDYLNFDSHGEGLQLPRGQIISAHSSFAKEAKERDYDHLIRMRAWNELEHRAPYGHRVASHIKGAEDDFNIMGEIRKDVNDPTSGESSRSFLSSWGAEKERNNQVNQFAIDHTFNDTHKDAMQDVSSKFEQFNRDRQGTGRDVSSSVSRAINTPDIRGMEGYSRKFPHMLGSQFLKIVHHD